MLELEALLRPVSDDSPCGVNLRLEAGDLTFQRIEEMRQEVDPALDPEGRGRSADWKGVVEECTAALTERTKDLELAAYLVQGVVQQEGFAGLRSGLELIRALLEAFWENLYPGYDEGEIVEAIRARPLTWLGTSQDFLDAVKRVPLSEPIGGTPYGWFDYEQSRRVDSAGTKADQTAYNELLEAGLITGEQWRSSLAATPPERLGAIVEAIRGCRDELRRLEAACVERFDEDPPNFVELANLLDDCVDHIEAHLSGQGAAAEGDGAAPPAAAAAGGTPTAPAGGGGAAVGGPITSRDQAYRVLREVAQYLRRTEPHSPVAVLIDRAIRWGDMNFEKLFEDVVKDESVRDQVREVLGIESRDES
jgi:type VI secretion system protein ImpA